MNEYKIEKGFPVPDTRGMRKYPWRKLEVGDSFFVAGGTTALVSPSASGFSKRNPGLQFTCMQVEGGVRVWRVA